MIHYPILAISLALAQPVDSTKEITLSPTRVFDDARTAYLTKPVADRVSVTLQHEGRSPVSASLTLRIAPGKAPDQSDATIAIDAGDLHATIENRRITAVLNSRPENYFQAEITPPYSLTSLADTLSPMPLPQLALLWSASGQLPDPTLHTRGITWQPAVVAVADTRAPIKLTGQNSLGPAALTFDQSTLRLRSFTAKLPSIIAAEHRTLNIIAEPTEPGDAKSWLIDTSKRTRVNSLHELAIKPTPKRETQPDQQTKDSPPANTTPAEPKPAEPMQSEPKPHEPQA